MYKLSNLLKNLSSVIDNSPAQAIFLTTHIQPKQAFEKPFKCNEYDYSNSRVNFSTHVQAKHTIQRPFKCEEYDNSASQAAF